jgi:hypothetical protein
MIFGMPWERALLQGLAAGGAVFVALGTILAWETIRRARESAVGLRFVIALLMAIFCSLAWADVLAHNVKVAAFRGENPFVWAVNGEWEGWTGPTLSGDVDVWRATKCASFVYGTPHGVQPPVVLVWYGWPGSGNFCR